MKLSIISVTLNSAATLADTLQSLNSQSIQNFEHLIKDGGSLDDTLKIARDLRPASVVITQKDTSIFEAYNQGVNMASGDIVGFLNSDDIFFDEYVVERILQEFEAPEKNVAVFGVQYFDKPKGEGIRIRRDWPTSSIVSYQALKGVFPPHPGVFFRKNVFDRVGAFDESYRVAGDFEWIVRCLKLIDKNEFSITNNYSTLMRLGGASSNRYQGCLEDWRGSRAHNLSVSCIAMKKLTKISGFTL